MINFTSDIVSRNPYFDSLMNMYKEDSIFNDYIYLYLIALTVGAYYDKWIEDEDYKKKGLEGEIRTIPRNVINSVETNRQIEHIFRNIVLRTTKLDITVDDRLLTAFDPNNKDSKVPNVGKFLNSYANYGFEILNKLEKTTMTQLACVQDLMDLIDYVKNDIPLDSEVEYDLDEIEED